MKVLSIDPSYTATGWILIDHEKEKALRWGVLRMNKVAIKRICKYKSEKTLNQQFGAIKMFNHLYEETKPDLVLGEFPHGSQVASTAKAFSTITTALLAMSPVEVKFYLESEAKKAVVGRGKNVDKNEIVLKTLAIYHRYGYIPPKPQYMKEAIADALAIYHAYKNNGNSLDYADIRIPKV